MLGEYSLLVIDHEKVRPLPRDNEYLIDPESKVKHFDVLLDDRK